ncbi:hypothetical protein ASC90_27530 [Rhizobium sp. Root1220]|nr:hypothetical protein ASC90_27530 [Rhizobium sp. Root1220]
MLASILAILSVRFFFLAPQYTFDPGLMGNEALRRFLLYGESIFLIWLLGSAQRRAQERSRRSEGYLADAQALSRTGSVGFTAPDKNMFWSTETYRILGLDLRTTPSMKKMLERIHPEDRAMACRAFYCVTEPSEAIEFEHRIVTEGGSTKHLRICGKAEQQVEGAVRVSAAMMDVTETRRISASLRKAQSELAHVARLNTMGELVASITHEINQPLGAMKLSANTGLRWLNRDTPELEKVGASLKRVSENATRAEALISKLRNMAKKGEFEAVPISLNQIVSDVIELLHGEANERGITCVADLDTDLPLVKGDEVQLQQIAVNLVMNSFDAMAASLTHPRQIVVRSRNRADSVALEVADTGPGIRPDMQDRLFDAFFTTKSHGMGMGLSICRSIVEAHDGTIEAFNNELGGATFRIALPVRSTETLEPSATSRPTTFNAEARIG